MDYSLLQDFLHPLDPSSFSRSALYQDSQFGKQIMLYEESFPEIEQAELILLGMGERRGAGNPEPSRGPDGIRSSLYCLFHWHPEFRLADIGNIRRGATLNDSYAALRAVCSELLELGKTVIILGGSHDLTYAQYQAFVVREKLMEATVVDARIDLQEDSSQKATGFLMDLFTSKPNFLRHYNHIGFQSYLVQPGLLETLDKMRFDCYRLGLVQENPEEMEPVIRSSDMISFDLDALRHGDSPASRLSPSGFFGPEACSLARYAGMSPQLNSIGLYGYEPDLDQDGLSADQAAQMIWYFIEGRFLRAKEAPLSEREAYLEFHVSFTDSETLFLRSKRTGRWWMQMPDSHWVPCSYRDYQQASRNEIPERWLRVQERL